MPLYSDHYYYGSGQPPSYYSSYTPTSSRISSSYSFPYMSPISAMLSAGIGTNPMPRGLRSYSPMLSAISETGSPLMSRRDIGNHRSSPRHLAGKNYYRQRPIVIDTDNLDLSKRKKEDSEDAESTPGMISRAKTIVRMHTRKLKENPELKKKKTQAEILMEKYFIKEKPVKEEETTRRKRIWEEREEELNNTPVRGGTIKRTNTVRRMSNPVVVDEVVIPEKLDDIIPVRKMSIDSELLKEEEALLDCMIQEELGFTNKKEMKLEDREDEITPENVNTKRRKSKDLVAYGRRKSSVDVIVDENGTLVSKKKSHVRKKKTSKPLPLDEVDKGDVHSGSDSSSKDNKDETKVHKRRSTKKKKPPKFKIDALLVEEKSSPKLLKKFQYEVIVEEGKNSDKSSVKQKSVKHINKEDIPKEEQQKLVKEESSVKSDVIINTNISNKAHVAGTKHTSNVCDRKCDNLTNNLINKLDILKHNISIDSKTETVNIGNKGEQNLSETINSNKTCDLEQVKSKKADLKRLGPMNTNLEKVNNEEKINENSKVFPGKNKQNTSLLPAGKTDTNKTKQKISVAGNPSGENEDLKGSSNNQASSLQKSTSEDDKSGKNQSAEKLATPTKQKSLTPDLGRKNITNATPKSEPNTPTLLKKQLLSGSDTNKNKTNVDLLTNNSLQGRKADDNLVDFTSTSLLIDGKDKLDETKLQTQSKVDKPKNITVPVKKPDTKLTALKTEIDTKPGKEVSGKVKDDQKEGRLQFADTNKAIDEVKNRIPTNLTLGVQNKGVLSLNKKEEAVVSLPEKKSQTAVLTQETSKEKFDQLNTKTVKTQLGKKEDKSSVAVPVGDTVNGLQDISSVETISGKIQPKQVAAKKELDFNSNQVGLSEIKSDKNVALKKVGVAAQKDAKSDNALKVESNKEKGKELKSENSKNAMDKNVNAENDNTTSILNKNAFEMKKSEPINKDLMRKDQSKDNIIKNKSNESPSNTEISAEKKLNGQDIDQTRITKLNKAEDVSKDKLPLSKAAEKTKTGTEALSKGKPPLEKTKNIDHGDEIDKLKEKVEDKKVETKKVGLNKQTTSIQPVPEKIQKTNKLGDNLKDDTANKTKPELNKIQLDVKSKTSTNSADKNNIKHTLNDVKSSESKVPPKPIKPDKTVKEEEVKQSDKKIVLNQPEENIKDKLEDVKKLKTKQTDVLSKEPVTKTPENLSNDKKDQKTEQLSKTTDKQDKKQIANNIGSVLPSKDQHIDKTEEANKNMLDKEKTIKENDKKKRIKSESDALDNEISSISEKSQSLKESTSEKSSKKKKKSKDKDSSKRKKNAKSPRKIKESPKSAKDNESKSKNSESDEIITTAEKNSSSTIKTIVSTKGNTTTTTTTETSENKSRELSKRSTRLLHFINKCMRLSEDDDNIFIEYSDEDESSSSSEYSSDYTSDSEDDTLTEASDGSSESRDHGSPTRHPSNSALSLDDESPRGRGGDKAGSGGRVTPPATTIPKFRKYTMDDFQFLKVLGKGSFGKVLLAELRGTQYYYAVKCLKKDVVLEDDDVECTLIERKVLALGTNHPYLCHLFCTFQTESHLFFVMEYLNGGDLMFHIQQQGRFDEGRARFYAAEIVSGLKFLHKKGIVYRDLKLDNILLDFDGHVRIADFGMCKLQIYLDRTADTFCGTPDYMAPEIIKGLKYNQCVDWWSFGILMYEMLVGQSPFSGCDEDDLFWCICNRQPHYPRFITVEAKRILMQLLEKEASKRLGSCENGAMEVMAHPFFNGMDWDRLERRELMPPFKPNVKHPLDVHYFDKHFTAERACLTPIDPSILQSMDQTQFQGFSYTNPNVTD